MNTEITKNDIILARFDVKKWSVIKISPDCIFANYSDLCFDVTVLKDMFHDISDKDIDAEFPFFRGPW